MVPQDMPRGQGENCINGGSLHETRDKLIGGESAQEGNKAAGRELGSEKG